MRVEIEKITVTITKEEAFDIINHITESMNPIENNYKYPKAVELAQQLRSIFMNSVRGIHF